MITLKTLPQATEQQVFDQVALHMLTQNQASFKSHDCAYRGDNGLMCAAGCLIGDDEYKPEMDSKVGKPEGSGTSWSSLVKLEMVPANHQNLIGRLQSIHDGVDPDQTPSRWPEQLINLADSLSLNTDVVTGFVR